MKTQLKDIEITVLADIPQEITRSATIIWGVTLDTRDDHFKIYRSVYDITLHEEDEEGVETETAYNPHEWDISIEFDTEINGLIVNPKHKTITLQ